MFKTKNNIIQEIIFKKEVPEDWTAWTGLMFINEWDSFFSKLSKLDDNEFIQLIKPGNTCKPLNTWLDFGSPKSYQTALTKSQKFDFSKKSEVTYICNERVVKWWKDKNIPKKKSIKPELKPELFPLNCEIKGQFMAYDFVPGKTLYEFNNPYMFARLLKWLDNNVWSIVDYDLSPEALSFYKDKTMYRIDKFLEKYPALQTITHVNGIKIKPYYEYLNNINWKYLSTNVLPSFIHGDLQFDNIIMDKTGDFKLIDWRQDFAGLVDYGDIYYDLAKLAGGLIVNYASIKQHNFNYKTDGSDVTINIPNIDEIDKYQQILKEFINSKGWDYKKVQLLIPIIFWNMSPLHEAPFDLFLWYLGMKIFEEL